MRRAIGAHLRHHEELIWLLPVAGASVLLFLAAQLAGLPHGVSAAAVLGDYAWKVLRALPLLGSLVFIFLLVRALAKGGGSPLRSVAEPLKGRFDTPLLVSAAAGPLLLMPLLFAGFGVLKMLLPLYVPFGWDDSFAAADRALFFGHQPWELTHALFGSFAATLAIDRLYTLWVLILSFAILGFACFAPRYDRARFFLSFSAAWVLLGVVGAWLFSSAGPCYAGQIGARSAPEFAPLMERLHALSGPDGRLGAVGWQDVLWQAHAGRRYGFGMGISAMPSLHNAIALLYALALARFGRLWGIAGWSFAAIIFVASVHLGWHYAVDGLVAGAAMAAIWWASGRYLARSGYAAAVQNEAREPAISTPVLA